ncbi:probable E3 ubiquitin-protein ligase RNF217 [Trichonephila clavata]|uniref:RBR-type E3 ubiquitin transferase n=1 Tax=Trichonephila clavata TaxID=2740835 RepID=A0A8X6EZ29_TRICU|nr:probable E3 ubiquitin-protein ligase RNF217 [Trichonephila clavata]
MANCNAASSDGKEIENNIDRRLLPQGNAAENTRNRPKVQGIKYFLIPSPSIPRKILTFKFSPGCNSLLPLDGPMSVEYLHILLDTFVNSFGSEGLHLGRYHPQSDPEQFVSQNQPSDTSSLSTNQNYFSTFKAKREAQPPITQLYSAATMPKPYNPSEFTYEGYYRDPPTKAERRTEFCLTDLIPNPNESVMGQLKDSLFLVQRLFNTEEKLQLEDGSRLDEVLELIPDDTYFPRIPCFPVGKLKFEECAICAKAEYIYRRVCCGYSACNNCLKRYYSSKVKNNQLKIKCYNPNCYEFAHKNEILERLDKLSAQKFKILLLLANNSPYYKSCPQCNRLTENWEVQSLPMEPNNLNYPRVICPSCRLVWCYRCQTAGHDGFTCSQNEKNVLRKRSEAWNGQKCPNCKIYIKNTFASDRMHCIQCNIDFCYKCGEKFRNLMFFGDHSSKLSIFGCKFCFKADQPLQRMAIRGAIFGGKLIAVPVLGAIAVFAGVLAVASSVIGLPMYKGVCLFRTFQNTQAPVGKPTPPKHHETNNGLDCPKRQF